MTLAFAGTVNGPRPGDTRVGLEKKGVNESSCVSAIIARGTSGSSDVHALETDRAPVPGGCWQCRLTGVPSAIAGGRPVYWPPLGSGGARDNASVIDDITFQKRLDGQRGNRREDIGATNRGSKDVQSGVGSKGRMEVGTRQVGYARTVMKHALVKIQRRCCG